MTCPRCYCTNDEAWKYSECFCLCHTNRSMGVQQERPSNPESIEVPVSGCNSSEGSTAREDALCAAGSALHVVGNDNG